MKLFRKLDEFPESLRGGALAIGNFDGVHRGHRQIVQRLLHHAASVGGPSVIFTFDPHPVRLLRPEESPPPLTWTDRKADLLAELGVAAMIAYPTDWALLALDYRDFFQQIVVERMGARAVVEGPNFFFGKDRLGDVRHLQELCAAATIPCEIVEPIRTEQGLVSSSRVRQLLREGEVAAAAEMLARPYRLRGVVVHGAARGAQLGFPTANLDGIDTLIPGFGIYAGRARIETRWHAAAIHIGPSPTFGDALSRVEVHLIDFEQSIYGQLIEVELHVRLRPIEAFGDQAELIARIHQDVLATRAILGTLE